MKLENKTNMLIPECCQGFPLQTVQFPVFQADFTFSRLHPKCPEYAVKCFYRPRKGQQYSQSPLHGYPYPPPLKRAALHNIYEYFLQKELDDWPQMGSFANITTLG